MSEQASRGQYPSTAFALSLVAGILIIVSGSLATFWAYAGTPLWSGMMGMNRGMMGPMGFGQMIFGGMSAFGLVSGIVVLVSAILLRDRPRESTTWGVLILVFSILSFFGMGGFFVGATIGIVGGALALSWKSETTG